MHPHTRVYLMHKTRSPFPFPHYASGDAKLVEGIGDEGDKLCAHKTNSQPFSVQFLVAIDLPWTDNEHS